MRCPQCPPVTSRTISRWAWIARHERTSLCAVITVALDLRAEQHRTHEEAA